MKKIVLLLSVFLVLACNKKPAKTYVESPEFVYPNIQWLEGNWKRSNDKEGEQTYETWTKNSETHYYGKGFTLKGTDTLRVEDMKIWSDGKIWNFEYKSTDDNATYVYQILEINDTIIKAHNDTIDFPQWVEYRSNDSKKLTAVISKDSLSIPYYYDRIKKLPK